MVIPLSSVINVLNTIVELGFVQIEGGLVVNLIRPYYNVYSTCGHNHPVFGDRWDSTVQYLQDYGRYHPQFNGSYFISIYDGWREMLEGVEERDRVYTDWDSYSEQEKKDNFSGVGTINEPRFYSNLQSNIYVNLPLPILSYSRHLNDSNVLLIPDHQFLESEFKSQRLDVLRADMPWDNKISQIMWRGGRNVNAGYAYMAEGYTESLALAGRDRIHPRDLACSISNSKGLLRPDIGQYVNASYDYTTIGEMVKYKYLLDLDGMVNAWSAFYWKMYSNSVVFKVRSHWEQWYYHSMVPWVHYIPLVNLSPRVVSEAFEWCEVTHVEECKQIALESAKFIRTLTYEYAIKEYIIH